MPTPARLAELLDRYDGFLLDAYGVLNDAGGALPGAAALIAELERRGRAWVIITNDASRLPSTVAARLRGFGIPVPVERVITSGALLAPYFAAHGLAGRRCAVLGTDESRRYVEVAGGVVVDPADRRALIDVLVVADDAGFEFLPGLEAALSACVRALEAGVALALVLPNPDLVYPKPGGDLGVTAGSVALIIEAVLQRRYFGAPRFVGLGKPNPPMYEEALRRVGPGRILAIGDGLDTDVAGALGAGLDVALVESGIARWRAGMTPVPTWLLPSIAG